MKSRYRPGVCHLASMHKKEQAVGPPFEQLLGCRVIPSQIDTDLLGTFTGEIERTLTPIACAKEKCYRALDLEQGNVGVANEGTFSPHPLIPFIHADCEVLFFADRNLGFELTLSKIASETNFLAKSIQDTDELSAFAKQTLFPSHALILRPQDTKDPNLIFKGIQDAEELYRIFQTCSEISRDRLVWVATDMRAHMNPTRMKNIEELAYAMATRLTIPCPACHIPGWGVVKSIPGLPCKACRMPTALIKSKIYGCCQCAHQEISENHKEMAEPGDCSFCNP
jgi:hypothetical protein